MVDTPNPDDRWQDELMHAIQEFAQAISQKHDTVPWPDHSTLEWAMTYLTTELWDLGLDSVEIERALKAALENLPTYAAGER